MPAAHHRPEWPDKVVFAALLVVVGGTIGALFAVLPWLGATVEYGGLVLLEAVHPLWTLVLCLAAVGLGLLGFRHQAWVWCAGGIGCALLSGGAFGLVALVALVAAVTLAKAAWEKEEMRHDAHVMHPWEWPDKAIIASLLLTILGAAAALEAVLAYMGRYEHILLGDRFALTGTWALLTAIVCLAAARQSFHQRTAWLAWTGAVLGLLLAPLWGLGAILALAAMVYLGLSLREGEFAPQAAA